jgi:hypothetical protein
MQWPPTLTTILNWTLIRWLINLAVRPLGHRIEPKHPRCFPGPGVLGSDADRSMLAPCPVPREDVRRAGWFSDPRASHRAQALIAVARSQTSVREHLAAIKAPEPGSPYLNPPAREQMFRASRTTIPMRGGINRRSIPVRISHASHWSREEGLQNSSNCLMSPDHHVWTPGPSLRPRTSSDSKLAENLQLLRNLNCTRLSMYLEPAVIFSEDHHPFVQLLHHRARMVALARGGVMVVALGRPWPRRAKRAPNGGHQWEHFLLWQVACVLSSL